MDFRKIRTHGSNGCENLTKLAVSTALLALTACGGGGSGEDEASLDLSNLQELPPSIGAATDGNINAATDVAETAAGQAISGEVRYTADSDFEGTDSVDYILVGADGTQSEGTLYIAVACADCLLEAPAQVVATEDSNGNPFCKSDDADPDGDGWGWENDQSCVPFIGAAVPALAAKSDSVSLIAGSTTAVSALRNDTIADRSSVTFAIDVQPSSGVIEAAEAGVVVYTAPDDFEGTDSLVYSLKLSCILRS